MVDFNQSIQQFGDPGSYAWDRAAPAAGLKALVLTPAQKKFVLDALQTPCAAGLQLSNCFTNVQSGRDAVELDAHKNYRVQFVFEGQKPDFVRDSRQFFVIRLFLGILHDKKMVQASFGVV